MFNVSTIAHMTHIKPIVQFLPSESQHCIVNGCNSFWYSCLQLIHISRNKGHIDQSFDKYLDMLENWLMNKLSKKESGDFIFRQDGAPPNWNLRVRQFSNIKLTDKWIGRSGQNDHDLISWPPRTHTIQFLFVSICEKVGLSASIPRNVDELKACMNIRSCCNHWQCNAGTRLARIGLSAWWLSCE